MDTPGNLTFTENFGGLQAAGDWTWLYLTENRKGVALCCPFCSQWASLSHHQVEKEEPLTIAESIICPSCRKHFYIKDGLVVGLVVLA